MRPILASRDVELGAVVPFFGGLMALATLGYALMSLHSKKNWEIWPAYIASGVSLRMNPLTGGLDVGGANIIPCDPTDYMALTVPAAITTPSVSVERLKWASSAQASFESVAIVSIAPGVVYMNIPLVATVTVNNTLMVLRVF